MCDWKRVFIGGVAGAMALPVLYFFLTVLIGAFFPFNAYTIPGARSALDSVGLWSIAYPFILAFFAALLYDFVRKSVPGTGTMKGVYFGGLLFLVVTLPNLFLVYSTMVYPFEFFPHMLVRGVVGFLVLGIIFTNIWKK